MTPDPFQRLGADPMWTMSTEFGSLVQAVPEQNQVQLGSTDLSLHWDDNDI